MLCPHSTTCRLYSQFTLQSALSVWKTLYCAGAYATCERFRRSEAGEPVPNELLPNGKVLEK